MDEPIDYTIIVQYPDEPLHTDVQHIVHALASMGIFADLFPEISEE